MTDEQLERVDLVLVNIAVAREIPSLRELDVAKYCQTVDDWTARFSKWLPGAERNFKKTPWKWKNDIRFFRVGMLQGFLGHQIGVRYIEEQKSAKGVKYTDPGDLFLNKLIDQKLGTCANIRHGASRYGYIARRMGWPVSLACAKSHFISRFDDGHVIYNIEATSTHPGAFASDPDDEYMRRFSLPAKAIAYGSDLRRLTMREMLGAFISLRARHYRDTQEIEPADRDYALSRVLFPKYRNAYIAAMVPMLTRGKWLFHQDELGHPNSLFEDLAPIFAPNLYCH